jgi:hypothetical protein
VQDTAGATLLEARVFLWGRDVTVSEPDGGRPFLLLRRRRSFPLTGRLDVLDPERGESLGAVWRNGSFADASGGVVGRFRDARSLRGLAAESVLAAVADALLGGDGSDISGLAAFVCTVGDRPAGSLAVARLPWPRDTGTEAIVPGARGTLAAVAARILQRLPERAGRVVRRPPSG